MTLRERIADLITGGALSRALWSLGVNQELAKRYMGLHAADRETLRAIIAQDTPHANATVKRMVRIAKEGLGE